MSQEWVYNDENHQILTNGNQQYLHSKDTIIPTPGVCIPFHDVVKITERISHSALTDLFGISYENYIKQLDNINRDGLGSMTNNSTRNALNSLDWLSYIIDRFSYYTPAICFIIIAIILLVYFLRKISYCIRSLADMNAPKQKKIR